MIRLFFILLVAVLIGLGAAWLADHDGLLTLTVSGYEVRTSAAFAVVLLFVLIIIAFVLMRLVLLVLGGPAKFSNFLSNRSAGKAYQALSTGLIAAAAGDTQEAMRAARDAE